MCGVLGAVSWRGSLDSEVENQSISLGGAGNVCGGSWGGQPPGAWPGAFLVAGLGPGGAERWLEGPFLAIRAHLVCVGVPLSRVGRAASCSERTPGFPVPCKRCGSCGRPPGPVSGNEHPQHAALTSGKAGLCSLRLRWPVCKAGVGFSGPLLR